MTKRTRRKPERNRSDQQTNSRRWRTYALMLICSLMLVSGFFFAGRQHFSSMDYGMKNSKLRKQVDELEAEKRRLLHAREVSLSPVEIKKAARKTGMVDQASLEGEVAQVASVTREKAVPPAPAPDTKPMVIKTAAVSAVASTISAEYPKPEKVAKQVKKALSAE